MWWKKCHSTVLNAPFPRLTYTTHNTQHNRERALPNSTLRRRQFLNHLFESSNMQSFPPCPNTSAVDIKTSAPADYFAHKTVRGFALLLFVPAAKSCGGGGEILTGVPDLCSRVPTWVLEKPHTYQNLEKEVAIHRRWLENTRSKEEGDKKQSNAVVVYLAAAIIVFQKASS